MCYFNYLYNTLTISQNLSFIFTLETRISLKSIRDTCLMILYKFGLDLRIPLITKGYPYVNEITPLQVVSQWSVHIKRVPLYTYYVLGLCIMTKDRILSNCLKFVYGDHL